MLLELLLLTLTDSMAAKQSALNLAKGALYIPRSDIELELEARALARARIKAGVAQCQHLGAAI